MDHVCTISFHIYSFQVFPQAIHLIYTDGSQAILSELYYMTVVIPGLYPSCYFVKFGYIV